MGRLRCLHFLGGIDVSPVQAQAKACGYQILPSTPAIGNWLLPGPSRRSKIIIEEHVGAGVPLA